LPAALGLSIPDALREIPLDFRCDSATMARRCGLGALRAVEQDRGAVAMAEPQRKAAFVSAGEGASLAWNGERLRYLVVGEQTEGRFALSTQTVLPGDGCGTHVLHQTQTGYFVLAGVLTFTLGRRHLIVPAGGFLNVAPGTAQCMTNAGSQPAELLTVSGPARLDEFHFRAGTPLREDEPLPAADVAAVDESQRRLAQEYGVELAPPEAARNAEPKLRLTLPGEGRLLAVAGDLYRSLATSDDTGGRFTLFQVQVSPGNGPPWHAHSREDELFLVRSGRVTFQIDAASRVVEAGGVVHLPCGVRHRFVNETDDVAELLMIVAPAGLERLFDAVGRPWHDLAVLPGPPNRTEFERLIEEAPKHGVELYF
jgi:mannose-6-phosphate isomerase-like protein (cupin superfamily)